MSDNNVPSEKSSGGTFETLYSYLPLRDAVVFPHTVTPLLVAREKSIQSFKALQDLKDSPGGATILLLTQKDPQVNEPKLEDLYPVGTLARVVQITELPDGSLKVFVEGQSRIQVTRSAEEILDKGLQCYGRELKTLIEKKEEIPAMRRLIMAACKETSSSRLSWTQLKSMEDTEVMADRLASSLEIRVAEKQEILSAVVLEERLRALLVHLKSEKAMVDVEKRILSGIRKAVDAQQKAYIQQLREQVIQKEVEEDEYSASEAKDSEFPDYVREKLQQEQKKLASMGSMSSEAVVVRNYIEWLRALPWGKNRQLKHTLLEAEEILDKAHYGLNEVKKSITKYLGVAIWTKETPGTVLCLAGPPGVGKTSIAQSIAQAAGREFVRISLGGLRDEAEIRGHRRTYVGAMPGRIIQSLKTCKTSNPLILLDEIDKVGQDSRGDPAAALLEVLDPQQNSSFVDHYLEIPFDLSNVLFICTANLIDSIPLALLDRMQIIQLSSYTPDEKLKIAITHLLPKQMKLAKLPPEKFSISEGALKEVIDNYTSEPGVRSLERSIIDLIREAIRQILKGEGQTSGDEKGKSSAKEKVHITKSNLAKYAGPPLIKHGKALSEDSIGAIAGLAYTPYGGDVLLLEATPVPGKGRLKNTGALGKVMTESVEAAFSFLRSKAHVYGLDLSLLDKYDMHLHAPAAAIPKDGPSGGVGIFLAMFSAWSQKPIRSSIGVTGEITIRGNVLSIGGLREKLIAAHRAGLKTVLIPESNVPDLDKVPDNIKQALEIIPISHASQALEKAIVGWTGPSVPLESAKIPPEKADKSSSQKTGKVES